jgi:hypothetical protein
MMMKVVLLLWLWMCEGLLLVLRVQQLVVVRRRLLLLLLERLLVLLMLVVRRKQRRWWWWRLRFTAVHDRARARGAREGGERAGKGAGEEGSVSTA